MLLRCEHGQTHMHKESKQSPLLPSAAVITSASPVIARNLPAPPSRSKTMTAPTHPPARVERLGERRGASSELRLLLLSTSPLCGCAFFVQPAEGAGVKSLAPLSPERCIVLL